MVTGKVLTSVHVMRRRCALQVRMTGGMGGGVFGSVVDGGGIMRLRGGTTQGVTGGTDQTSGGCSLC